MVTTTLDSTRTLAATLQRERLLAIVRGDDADATYRAIDVLASSGIALIEVSLTSTDALEVIQRAAIELRDAATIGAGTVRTRADADAAVAAGASFLVTPAVVPAVVGRGAPTIVGALTPTEIAQALDAGAVAIKLFPASLGGPEYLAALRQPFPDAPLVPVGGIETATAREYLSKGAVAVGVGSPLVADAGRGGDMRALAERARAFRAAIAEVVA